MTVKRIVSNIHAADATALKSFYGDILGMATVMDLGWIQTLAGEGDSVPQISFASEGGSGTPVPDLSIEVDNFEEVAQRLVDAGYAFEHGPVDEPWGVRRLYVRDPSRRLINILTHA